MIANAKSLAAVKKFCTAVAHLTLAQLMNRISTENEEVKTPSTLQNLLGGGEGEEEQDIFQRGKFSKSHVLYFI